MSFDAEQYRSDSLQGWEAAAAGWVRRSEQIARWSAPVSHWMVDAIAPQPGETVLELAAGLGETGMLAAELLVPMGRVIVSDQTEAMLAGARERAEQLGLRNVDFAVINAEWIDRPLASVDAVLCRWGYMLMADPATALAETRRVLRPGGRVALAVWDSIEHNPWASLPRRALAERGHGRSSGEATQASGAGEALPGPFALGDRDLLARTLEQAGLTEPRIETVEVPRRHRSFEDLWDFQLDVSRSFHDAVMELPEDEIEAVREALQALLAAHTEPDGAIVLGGRTLVALAEA
jgi:SAM-dependent methyltransferase